MTNNSGTKKMSPVYILDVLRRYTDENHKLPYKQISRHVEADYGMSCGIAMIRDNINLLIDAGYDIEKFEDNGQGCCLLSDRFTDSEVRMLIDSVMSSRYIKERYAKDLIEKLSDLGTVYLHKRTKYTTQIERWIHTDNPDFFMTIEKLDTAIAEKKRVRFDYLKYGVDKKLHSRRSEGYEVDPYQIVCNNGRYYLICNLDRHDVISNFRIDLIKDVEILDIPAVPFENLKEKSCSLDLTEYIRTAVNMYDGERVTATLRLKADRIGDVIDWFGVKGVTVMKEDGDMIEVKVTGSDNGLRMWAIQYGRIVEVVSPEGLRGTVRADMVEMLGRHEE